jgi:hypothetical protein
LHAFLETSATGQRLRFHAEKPGARLLNWLGAIGLFVSLVLITILITTGQSPVFLELSLISSMLVGAAALGPNVLRLPGWVREREAQMGEVSRRARTLIQGPAEGNRPQEPSV